MSRLTRVLEQRRMVLTVALLLSAAGLLSWFTMIRQEDPAFPYRYGYVLVPFPGADVVQVEHLVANPLEEEISEVEEVDEVRAVIRAGFLQLIIALKQSVYDTDSAWERVRVAVRDAQAQFPDGVGEPEVDDRQVDATTVVLAVGGSNDLLVLQEAAERLKRRLYVVDGVSRVRLHGDSGEQLTIALDDARIRALGLSPDALAEQLAKRNHIVPGGFVHVDGRQTLVRPQSDFRSVDEVRRTPVILDDGRSIPLAAIADVRLEPADPPPDRAWVGGEPVVAVAVTVQRNRVNAVAFGDRLRAEIERLRPQFAPLTITEMFYQPDRVASRLRELGGSLLLGVVIIAGLLLLFMGPRLGFVVAAIVPLVTLSSLAVFAMGGGVLHQMAVAGLVIALGLLVDNAIVMVENIQWHLDRGATSVEAAVASVRELARPLGAATGTTLAVFVPMVIARGDAADFTRAIPVTILIMLATSYAFALLVSPLLAERVLKARPRGAERSRMARVGARIGAFAVHNGAWVVGVALLLIAVAGVASRQVDRDFFPTTDRNQLVVDVYHAEGTPAETTAETVLAIGEDLATQPGVRKVYQFAGSSGPRFYYNLNENPRAPHIGRVVLETGSADDLEPLIAFVRDSASLRWPGAQLVARRLAQGPPAPAPVELRVLGRERAALAQAAETLTRLLRDIPGTVDVRHNLGVGIPSLRFEIDDALADSRGLDRERVARALAMQTQGVQVGTFRAGEDPVPILLRSPQGAAFDLEQLVAVNAYAADRRAVPVMDTGQGSLEWQPAVIHHWDLQPAVTVLSELEEGVTYAGVYEQLFEQLDELGWPPGIEIQAGGYQESSGEANNALYRTLPLGMLLLLFFLLLQFNSFRRVGIVLVTVPLAVAGVVPGLLLTGYAFGFMALLGVIALVGIVVNNAIVLIDVVDAQLAEGVPVEQAVIGAVARRTRPILLTTATTVAGLLPLTFADSTLWPPMAWSIISGLLLSTLLTLGVVPALCRWLLNPVRGD